jgi:DNA polymerase elongation subunit (family B)
VAINDAALTRQFVRAGFIVDHPPTYNHNKIKHEKFQGGTWLRAVRGVHEMAFELDVEAMYSNIILSGNVCFSTLPVAALTTQAKQPPSLDLLVKRSETDNDHDNSATLGVIPRFCQRLLASRARIRQELLTAAAAAAASASQPDECAFLEARRKAVKLGNNITYGCLGQPASKFSNDKMAAMIAAFGRGLLGEAAKLVHQHFPHELVIGGTCAARSQALTHFPLSPRKSIIGCSSSPE